MKNWAFWPISLKKHHLLNKIVNNRITAIILIALLVEIGQAQVSLPAEVVAHNSLQIESAVEYQKEKPAESIDLAGTLFRYGLFKSFELRFATGYNLSRENSKQDYKESINLQPGFKVHILEEQYALPELVFIGQASLPSISNENSDSKIEPGFVLAMEYGLSETIGLGINTGSDFLDGENFALIYSTYIGIDVSESAVFYLEVFGEKQKNNDSNTFLDGGFTYLTTPSVELEFSFGKSIYSDTNSWYINFGIVTQFLNIF